MGGGGWAKRDCPPSPSLKGLLRSLAPHPAGLAQPLKKHLPTRPIRPADPSLPDGSVFDATPPPASGLNARTRVHEYGGGEHLALGDGRLVFSNFS